MRRSVCILRTDGTNCDEELAYAFWLAGADPHLVHVNILRRNPRSLREFAMIGIPGGFSYGDDIRSGAVFANELSSFFAEELGWFAAQGRPIIGICNGFQILVQTGLLPGGKIEKQTVSLAHNDSGHFQCEWVPLDVPKSRCVFVDPSAGEEQIELQIAHGEGKFVAEPALAKHIISNGCAVLYYARGVNGSTNDIAGICNPEGNVFGLMPHPERFITLEQHPNWRRRDAHAQPHGISFFENGVRYAAQL